MTPNIIRKSQFLIQTTYIFMAPTIRPWYYPRENNTPDRVMHVPSKKPYTLEYQKLRGNSWVTMDFVLVSSCVSVKDFKDKMTDYYERKSFTSI